jgi:hypothetical protein
MGSVFSLVQDVIYFSSRIETTAQIVSIENLGSQEPYRVLVKYFNKYVGEDISCKVLLKKSGRVKIDKIEKGYANIYYSKYFPCAIYFVELNAPALGVLFIDGIMIVLMSLSIWTFKDGFKKS